MKVAGRQKIAAPRQIVWESLLDPEVLAGTLPGFRGLERVGDNEFAGALALGVGPVQGSFEGRVKLDDLCPPDSYSMRMEGRGGPGFVEGSGGIRLHDDGDGTMLEYDLDVQVGGRLAGLGQRLLDMTARMLTKQGLSRLTEAIEARV